MSIVLDASALLASAMGEPGAERVDAVLDAAVISAVNLAEVVGRLTEHGYPLDRIRVNLGQTTIRVAPFDDELAYAAGELRRATKLLGLSLGDRACISLARQLGLPVLTADTAWQRLDLGLDIRLIR